MDGNPIAPQAPGDAPLSLSDRWAEWRNRMVQAPAFRRVAQRFFPGRQIARHQARQLFDLCAGFVYAQVLDACIESRLLEALSRGPRPLSALAQSCRLSEEATFRLLEAARSLKLVEERSAGAGGAPRYGLGVLGASVLADPGIAAMVRHHRLLYADMADPLALLRNPSKAKLGAYWRYAGTTTADGLSAEEVANYSDLMGTTQAMVIEQIMAAWGFGRYRRLLDIGAGQGGFVRALADAYPTLSFTIFDLPAVVDRARERAAADGLADRVDVVGGNFLHDPLPQGADIITLVRVLFDHKDDTVSRLLVAAFEALPPGGRLLVAEPMARTPGADPVGDAYFGFYLWAMGGGLPRSACHHRKLLANAGFVSIKELSTPNPMIARVLTAVKPA